MAAARPPRPVSAEAAVLAALAELGRRCADRLLPLVIHETVRVLEAPEHHLPLILYPTTTPCGGRIP